PDNAKYRNNLAAALVDAGKENESFTELTAANPPAVAHYNLAYLLNEKGQRASAITHLQQAVAFDPSLKPASDMLAQLGGSPTAVARAEQPAQSLTTQIIEARPPGNAATEVNSRVASFAPQIEEPVASEPPRYHIG